MNIKTIQNSISNHHSQFITGTVNRQAAVIIPLIEKEGDLHVLFEIRSRKLSLQPGDICFPGGAIEDGETIEQAAVRETCEELLVEESQVELLHQIDGTIGPRMTPMWAYAAVIHDYKDTFSQNEVGEVFTVPLDELLKMTPIVGHASQISTPEEDFPHYLVPHYNWVPAKKEFLFYQWEDKVIWGATARILHSFLKLINL